MKIRSVRAVLFHEKSWRDGRTYEQGVTELKVTFRNFANAPIINMKSVRDNLLPEVNKNHEELGAGQLLKSGLMGSEAEYQGFERNSKGQ